MDPEQLLREVLAIIRTRNFLYDGRYLILACYLERNDNGQPVGILDLGDGRRYHMSITLDPTEDAS